MCKPLLIAQLHAAEVQYGILHRARHALAFAGLLTLKKCRENSSHEMNAGTGIADLRACHKWESVDFTGCRRGPACALGDVLINFAILVWPGSESLDGC